MFSIPFFSGDVKPCPGRRLMIWFWVCPEIEETCVLQTLPLMGNTYDKAHFRFSGNIHQFYGPVCSDLSCKSLICSSAAEFFMFLFRDLLDVCMAMHGPLAYGDIPMLQGHKNTLFTALRTGNHRPWPAIPEEDLNQEPHYGHFGLLSCQLNPNIHNSWGSTDVIHVRKQPLGSMQPTWIWLLPDVGLRSLNRIFISDHLTGLRIRCVGASKQQQFWAVKTYSWWSNSILSMCLRTV